MKTKIIPILLSAMTLLSGCTAATELSERAIIQAAAVDYSNGEYTVNALLFSGGGKDGLDVSQDNVIKVSGSGATFTEAVKQISLVCGKEIYMAENKLLIVGYGFERQSLTSLINTMYTDMRCSLNMPVCCAESAEMLADIRFKEGVTSAEKPAAMLRNAYNIGTSAYTTLLDILKDNEGGRATLIPIFEETENGSGLTTDKEGKTAVISGSRYIYNGRLYGNMDMQQTQGLLLILGERDRCYFSFTIGDTEHSCEAYSVRVDIVNGMDGRKAAVTAKFRYENGSALTGEALGAAERALYNIVNDALSETI